jgi:hypothetical protein
MTKREYPMHSRRNVVAALLLSGLAIGGLGHGAYAAGMKTYTNTAHKYTMQYPAAWTKKPKTQGTDVEFISPDTNAIVLDTVTVGTATKAEIKAQQATVLKGFGKAQGTLNYAVKSVNGVPFQISELVTKYQGKLLDVVLLDTVHGNFLYDFEGLTLYNKPTTKAETALVDQMFNSILLTK